MARDCRNTGYMQNNQTSGWSGTDDKTKGKPRKGKPTKARAKASLIRAKARTRTQEGVNYGKKGKTDSTKWRGTKEKQETQTGQEYKECGAQICRLILHGSKRQDSCHRRSPLMNSPIQHIEDAFQC